MMSGCERILATTTSAASGWVSAADTNRMLTPLTSALCLGRDERLFIDVDTTGRLCAELHGRDGQDS